MKVLMATSEAYPFFKSGGLGDVLGSLPQALKSEETDVRTIMPLYSSISAEYRQNMTFLCSFMVQLSWRNQYCGIFMLEHNGVTHYFIDNEYYFLRPYPYGQYDDAERYAFFCKAVLEALPHIHFIPDIIHAHDWMTALIPVYLRLDYSHLAGYWDIRTIFTIHNIQYQGIYDRGLLEDLFGISSEHLGLMEFDGCINLLKAAIETAHVVTTVSPTYADEIKSPQYAHGLQNILRANDHKLLGIVNGLNYQDYDPEGDKALFENYSMKDLEGKKQCKRGLQRMLNLPVRDDVPLIGVVSRLVDHKGFDMVEQAIEDIAGLNMQMVVLGTGDAHFESMFRSAAARYPEKFSANITFSNDLARKIYSGADIFLMPSQSEPCGLAQLISMRYGTIPVVRETGGLADTVIDFDADPAAGQGFSFKNYSAYDMMLALKRALNAYGSDQWKTIMEHAMASDFCWDASADKYLEIYKRIS